MVPLVLHYVRRLRGAEVCPVLVTRQTKVNEEGRTTINNRPCHDLSYHRRGCEDDYVNKRHGVRELPTIQYGHAFTRFVQGLAAMKEDNPDHEAQCRLGL